MARVALTDDNGALYGAPATWLDGRFAPKGQPIPVDRGQKFMAKLEHGTQDANVFLMGDSTGNENIEWFRLGVGALMADYPGFSADYRLWSDTTKSYGDPVTVQTGGGESSTATTFSDTFNRTAANLTGSTPEVGANWMGATASEWALDGTKAVRQSSAASTVHTATGNMTGDQTVTVTGFTINSTPGASTKDHRILAKYVDGSNYLMLQIAVNTSGFVSVLVSKRIANTAQTLYAIDTGIPGNTESVTFDASLSVSGLNVSATVNGVTGSGTITQADADALAGSNAAGIYGSVATAGASIDSFKLDVVGTGAGAKTVHFYNGSLPGSSLNYQMDNFTGMFPVDPDLVLVSSVHNYGIHTGDAYLTFVRDFVAMVLGSFPGAGIVVGSQNTRFGPANYNTEYHLRNTALRAEVLARGWGYLPVIEAFRARPDKGQSYVKSDGVHPTTSVDAPNPDNGSSLWSRVFLNYVDGLKQPVVS